MSPIPLSLGIDALVAISSSTPRPLLEGLVTLLTMLGTWNRDQLAYLVHSSLRPAS